MMTSSAISLINGLSPYGLLHHEITFQRAREIKLLADVGKVALSVGLTENTEYLPPLEVHL